MAGTQRRGIAVTASVSSSDAQRKSSLRRDPLSGSGVDGAVGSDMNASVSVQAASHQGGRGVASPSPVLYDLVGLVQHTGGLEHGHYTSNARDDGSSKLHVPRSLMPRLVLVCSI